MVKNGIKIFQNVNLALVKGKTNTIVFEVKDADGVAIDLRTDYTAKVEGRTTKSTAATVFAGDEGDMIVLGNGTLTLKFLTTDTSGLTAGATGVFGVELTKTTGAVVTDLVDGVFGVKASPVHA